MKVVGGFIVTGLVLTFLFLIGLAASAPSKDSPAGATSANCVVDVVPAADVPTGMVAGYSGDQLTNAAQVIAAGSALGLNVRDQTIGVMTAMGESGLRVLDYGDGAGPDSRGLFQQRANGAWGSYADRMDPFTSATNFFKAMMRVQGREGLEPTIVANRTQINRDPNHYAKYWPAAVAVVAALGGGGTCASGIGAPGGDGRQLATALVAKIDSGKITGLSSTPTGQIRAVAAGTNGPNCNIDVRVLQIITIASDTFDTVGISSINRLCSQTLAGAGTRSRHYAQGGGHAVDFYAFNGTISTGADPNSIKLIQTLDALMPPGSMVGQVQCRAVAGTTLTTTNLKQFPDSCNHFHVDVDPNTSTLLGATGHA